jgi:hypothetical protein
VIANHDGGSLVYVPGDANAPRADEVVRGMLDVQGVVAVVRQDAGRAVVVAREIEGMLVLDHFRQPLASAERIPLVAEIEAAQVSAMAAALAPGPVRPLLVSPKDGTIVEIDRAKLEEIDRAAMATRSLLDLDEDDPAPATPPALFDRIAWISPFGESGTVLRIEHQLSADGLAWAQTLGDLPLVGNVGTLGLAAELPPPPEPVRPTGPTPQRFVLRGTAVSTWGVHGVHRFAALASLLEITSPGSLGGDQSAWQIDWPAVALPPELGTPSAPYAGVRGLVVSRPYRLESRFDSGRTRLVVEIRPR